MNDAFSFTGFKATLTVPRTFSSKIDNLTLNYNGIAFVSETEVYDQAFAGPMVTLSDISAVPEVTSSFTLFGLISSGLLLRRRTQSIRTSNVEH